MVTWERYTIVGIISFVSLLLPSSHTFIQRCPEMKELETIRRYWNCLHRKEYHCLAIDVIELNTFREECRTSDWVSKGNYPVIRGENIDYEICSADSYQPVLFRSNAHFKCIYLKSNCSLEGQVEMNVGTTTSDKACRCDYNKGFAFVTRPRNPCACVPSKEDCSCYIKRCAKGQTLNSDYQCTPLKEIHGSTTCNVIALTGITDANPNNSSIPKTILIDVDVPHGILGLCFRKQTEKSDQGIIEISPVKAKDPLPLSGSNLLTTGDKSVYIQRNRIDNENNKKDYWKREEHRESTQKSASNLSTTGEKSVYTHRNIMDNANDKTDNCKSEDQKDSSQKSDIIILHSDVDVLDLNRFKGRLLSVACKEGYNDIQYFDRVFPSTDTISVQDAIKHCKLLVFYISTEILTFATEVEKQGLTRNDIVSVLKMTDKYPRLRTVCANKSLNIKTDMDYSKYIDGTINDNSCTNDLKSMLKDR
ncbi:uncharacterized protein LOC134709764 isoform X2 [Mytilus trossulus]|uniref:uncharacterized protein LOC134709764 isoform X2 n=1 Tax=Mytilus trossulus TaxID=6551 RepID=UPI0030073403